MFLGPGIYASTRLDAVQRSLIFFLSTQHKDDTGATFDGILNFERHASLVTLIFAIFIVLEIFYLLITRRFWFMPFFPQDSINVIHCHIVFLGAVYISNSLYLQHCTARSILGGCKYDHITSLLKEIHWLPIEHRITFKLLLITFNKAPNNLAPCYNGNFCAYTRLIG